MADYDVLGFNYRMTDVQAAIGLVQLRKLDALVGERRRWAAFYESELADVPWIATPRVPEGFDHAWQSYVLRIDESRAPHDRNGLMEALHERASRRAPERTRSTRWGSTGTRWATGPATSRTLGTESGSRWPSPSTG